jgi:hypothetical protein
LHRTNSLYRVQVEMPLSEPRGHKGGERYRSPAALPPGNNPGRHWESGWVGPQSGSGSYSEDKNLLLPTAHFCTVHDILHILLLHWLNLGSTKHIIICVCIYVCRYSVWWGAYGTPGIASPLVLPPLCLAHVEVHMTFIQSRSIFSLIYWWLWHNRSYAKYNTVHRTWKQEILRPSRD